MPEIEKADLIQHYLDARSRAQPWPRQRRTEPAGRARRLHGAGNWRFAVRGDAAVREELGRWYADAGHFEELTRTPLPTGELVEFTLRWEEAGVPFAAHQAHVVEVAGDRIVRDQVWCGGRWPAALLAEMAEAGNGVA